MTKPGRMKILVAAAIALTLATIVVERAQACACCTDPGQRYVDTVAIDGEKNAILAEMKFAEKAELFTGERDVEDIKGIKESTGAYKLTVTKTGDQMVFDFRDENGREGQLSFVMPKTLSVFEVDPREPYEGPGNGPPLYKEWKMTGPASASGIFSPSAGRGQRMTLIYQGRGNSCTDWTDFSHWTLVVHGPVAEYHLFGRLEGSAERFGIDSNKTPATRSSPSPQP